MWEANDCCGCSAGVAGVDVAAGVGGDIVALGSTGLFPANNSDDSVAAEDEASFSGLGRKSHRHNGHRLETLRSPIQRQTVRVKHFPTWPT
jgi:hypothetical protein